MKNISTLWNYHFKCKGRLIHLDCRCLSNFSAAFFDFTSHWKLIWVLSLAKSTSHFIFFNIIVQPWVLLKPTVLEGRFLFTINGFRELKCLWWLAWLIIHGYFGYGVTTVTSDLFSRTMVILLLLWWMLLRLLQLVTWFEEKNSFFCLVLKWFVDHKHLLKL